MLSGGSAAIRRWASSELDCLLCRRTFCYLPRTCIAALFCTSSMSAKTVDARQGPPIKVSLNDSAGRGVFTTRRIGSGELMHTAKPLVTHPSLAFSDRVCHYCLRKLNKDASSGPFSSLKGESGSSYCFCSEECRDVSKMEEEFELLKWTFLKAQIDEKLTGFLTKQWYVGVLARIRINAFRIELVAASYEDILASATASVAVQAAVGNAVYILPSFYNHDCDPNAHIVWIDSAFAKLKALRNIEEGEELRICYIDASMDCDARQKLLSEGFGFQCRCFRCLSHD